MASLGAAQALMDGAGTIVGAQAYRLHRQRFDFSMPIEVEVGVEEWSAVQQRTAGHAGASRLCSRRPRVDSVILLDMAAGRQLLPAMRPVNSR
ncbi:hypothetical protein [Nocardia donostiensis]|uniref:Uncharacterized protein n=1 Tax=Nocardia donostiensis TaxID=1538463 RepID=A0A1W0BKD5_9NOCA|nr:hypothetical protein [Nocardia donostiensis]ONM48844.1 hypothetical protein B0T46_10195 [Nocardia donostiensis]OQS22901.1 hypothetical protein B0T44_04270 [Nocardia donostiensis]